MHVKFDGQSTARKNFLRALALFLTVLSYNLSAIATATFSVTVTDGPNLGFNDPTPAAPIGGNPGVTIGEQRLNAFNFAASIWAQTIDSTVAIALEINFDSLSGCTLGQASTFFTVSSSADASPCPGFPAPNIWYPASLANKLMGTDVSLGQADASIAFANTPCNSEPWYYGLDSAPPNTAIDFVLVALHEIGHSIGFSSVENRVTGSFPLGYPDIFSFFVFDATQATTWNLMTDAQRQASVINSGNVYWNGTSVTTQSPSVLTAGAGTFDGSHVLLYTPAVVTGSAITHWATATSPFQVMEPSLPSGIARSSVSPPIDLTFPLMQDIGYFTDTNLDCIPDATCPNNCDDGNPCNGTQICDLVFGCIAVTPPVVCGNINCQENQGCNSSSGLCEYAPVICPELECQINQGCDIVLDTCQYIPDPSCENDPPRRRGGGRLGYLYPGLLPPMPVPEPPLVPVPEAPPIPSVTPAVAKIPAEEDKIIESKASSCATVNQHGQPGVFLLLFMAALIRQMMRKKLS